MAFGKLQLLVGFVVRLFVDIRDSHSLTII